MNSSELCRTRSSGNRSVDTRLLLNSFSKGEQDNVFVLNEGSMTIEVGTNVKYAEYADKGHWLNPKG